MTGLLATPAFLGTMGHGLVVGELLAFFPASVAGLSADLADQRAKQALAGDNLRCRRADVRAILAGLQGCHMHLFAVGKHRRAVVRACVALALAIGASFGTFVFAVPFMGIFRTLLGYAHRMHRGQRSGRNARDTKLSSSDHGKLQAC